MLSYGAYTIQELLELKLDDVNRDALLSYNLTVMQVNDAALYLYSKYGYKARLSYPMTFMDFLFRIEDANPRTALSYIANNPHIPSELRNPIVMYRDDKVLHRYFEGREFEEIIRHNDSVAERLFIQRENRPKARVAEHLRQRLARIHSYELNDTQVSQAGVALWNQYGYFRDIEGVNFGGYLEAKKAAIEMQNQRNDSGDDFWYSL